MPPCALEQMKVQWNMFYIAYIKCEYFHIYGGVTMKKNICAYGLWTMSPHFNSDGYDGKMVQSSVMFQPLIEH